MADNVQPDAGERREEPTSGLLLSVDPLQGGTQYKLGGDDSDSDKGGLLGDDGSDADGGDTLGGDADGSDGSDAVVTDTRGGDADGGDSLLGGDSDASDADGSDEAGEDAGSNDGEADDRMNPLGIGDTNVDGTDAK